LGLIRALIALAIVGPIALAIRHIIPMGVGLPLSILLAIPAVPALLTLDFLSKFSVRIAVIEQLPARIALRRGWEFLHGRLSFSLRVTVGWIVGSAICAGTAGLALLFDAAIAGLAFLVAGKILAIVVGVVLAIPVVIVLECVQGTFRSALWTLGYLRVRQAA
jgi:hypothetical protein